MTKKKLLVFISLFLFIVLFFSIKGTFALFESDAEGTVKSDLAKWEITVNNTSVSRREENSSSFPLGSIVWNSQNHVKAGKAAPGSTGQFNIIIIPTGTEVSFLYELTFDLTDIDNDEFKIQRISEVNGKELIRTDENTYTGIARLSDIKRNVVYNVKVELEWINNESNNEKDYNLTEKAILDEAIIPVRINLIQYTGEEITEYVPEVSDDNEDMG